MVVLGASCERAADGLRAMAAALQRKKVAVEMQVGFRVLGRNGETKEENLSFPTSSFGGGIQMFFGFYFWIY